MSNINPALEATSESVIAHAAKLQDRLIELSSPGRRGTEDFHEAYHRVDGELEQYLDAHQAVLATTDRWETYFALKDYRDDSIELGVDDMEMDR